jgi:hypothetical protein
MKKSSKLSLWKVYRLLTCTTFVQVRSGFVQVSVQVRSEFVQVSVQVRVTLYRLVYRLE